MPFNSPKFALVKGQQETGAKSEIDLFLAAIIRQIEEALDYFKDQQLATQLFTLWLEFFQKLRNNASEKTLLEMTDVAFKYEETLNTMLTSLRQQDAQLRSLKGVSDRVFSAEAALQQERADTASLRAILKRAEPDLTALPQLRNRADTAEAALAEESRSSAQLRARIAQLEKELEPLPDYRNRALAAENALKPLAAEKVQLASRVQALETKLRGMTELSDQLFMTETALTQRTEEVKGLQRLLAEAREQKELQAQELADAIRPAREIGGQTLELLSDVMQAVKALGSQKTSIAHALLQLADSLPATERVSPPTPVSSNRPEFADVGLEIQSRRQYQINLMYQIAHLEDLRQQLEDDLETETSEPRRKNLENRLTKLAGHITRLVGLESGIKSAIASLEEYQSAVSIVLTGAPKELIGQPLPELPDEFVEEAGPEFSEPSPIPDNARYGKLQTEAQVHSLPPEAVLLITLYQILNEKTGRGLQGVYSAARDCGILTAFGIETKADLVDVWLNWLQDFSQPYLSLGTVAGVPICKRTETGLPWEITSILSGSEAVNFLKTWLVKVRK